MATMDCPCCEGSGREECPNCDGTGVTFGNEVCTVCRDGYIDCSECLGDGAVDDGQGDEADDCDDEGDTARPTRLTTRERHQVAADRGHDTWDDFLGKV